MEPRAVRHRGSDDGSKSHSCALCRRRDKDGPDQGKDQEESLDPGRRHAHRDPLVVPGREVRYHLPLHAAPGRLAAEKPVPVIFF